MGKEKPPGISWGFRVKGITEGLAVIYSQSTATSKASDGCQYLGGLTH
jgi:hypothetical protein